MYYELLCKWFVQKSLVVLGVSWYISAPHLLWVVKHIIKMSMCIIIMLYCIV